jgi:hypothetical protein
MWCHCVRDAKWGRVVVVLEDLGGLGQLCCAFKEMVSGVGEVALSSWQAWVRLAAKQIQATWVSIKLRAREWCAGPLVDLVLNISKCG